MNNFILLLFGLLLFSNAKPDFPAPPGTVKVGHNLFVDKNPVTYLGYYEFLSHIKKSESYLINEMIPEDTTLTYKNEILWNNPKFNDFPIFGLNERQIISYCQWRSSAVNTLIKDAKLRCGNPKYWVQFDTLDPNKQYSVVYSLPSAEEVKRYYKKVKRQRFDETSSDGIQDVEKRSKAKHLNRDNLYTFRCVAVYKIAK